MLHESPAGALVLFLLLTLVPPLLFLAYLRTAERHRPEPWFALAKSFAWGATVGIVVAVIPQLAFRDYVESSWPWTATWAIAVVLVAPVTEEIAKALGFLFVTDVDPEPEDGFVYGGALGLGFAATENVLFVASALLIDGREVALMTALYRGVVTVALHGALSAIAGAGIWRARYRGATMAAVGALGLAILLHAVYNASVQFLPVAAVLVAAAGAVYAFWRVRRRVRALDARPA